MAIGLSLMFNVRLPLNFDSPYKATNIIDFWRRWHMTLSAFLRDYLYIPLGGNRKGPARRYLNLMITMLLGGLWHGAGWTFVVWGGLHGLYLMINHGWRELKARLAWTEGGALAKLGSGALTFTAVVVAWVFFRSDSFISAQLMLTGMLGFNGISLPISLEARLAPIVAQLPCCRIVFEGTLPNTMLSIEWSFATVTMGLVLVWFLPNVRQMMRNYKPTWEDIEEVTASLKLSCKTAKSLTWKPSVAHGFVIGLVFWTCILLLNRPSEFIYFQF